MKKFRNNILSLSNKKKLPGYSFVEVLVVLGLFVIIIGFAFPFTINLLLTRRADSTTHEIATALFRYQQNAYSGKENKHYGMAFTSSSYSLLEWEDGNPADVVLTINLPPNLEISEINLADMSNEISFAPSNFRPNTTGNIVISDGTVTYALEINPEGLIQYYEQ